MGTQQLPQTPILGVYIVQQLEGIALQSAEGTLDGTQRALCRDTCFVDVIAILHRWSNRYL